MTFTERVVHIIRTIPRGKVASYGQVAALAGSPGAARQVGFILRSADPDSVPWWRVINNAGILSIKGSFVATKLLQKKLLESEKVYVTDQFRVDMAVYRYIPTKSELSGFYKLQK